MSRLMSLVLMALLALGPAIRCTSPVDEVDAAGAPTSTGTLALDGPAAVEAGQLIELEIIGAHRTLDEASVVVASTAGTTAFKVSLANGWGVVALGPKLTEAAGTTTVWVVAGSDEVVTHISVSAAGSVFPLVPLVGPKSIVADSEDHTMVVVLPVDQFGNPAADGDLTRVSARRPSGRVDNSAIEQTGLVVWQRMYSGTVAGRTEVAARLGDVTGPTADLDEVAGPPVSVTVDADDAPRQADGRSLLVVQTNQLVDRFGNIVPDGTAVRMIVDESGGRRQATVMTIDGRAALHLEAPDTPGTLRVWAETTGVTSAVLDLDFAAAVDDWPTAVSSAGTRWQVDVGPVRTIDAGFVPDGTLAALTDNGQRMEEPILSGTASFELGAPLTPEARVEILGITREVDR